MIFLHYCGVDGTLTHDLNIRVLLVVSNVRLSKKLRFRILELRLSE